MRSGRCYRLRGLERRTGGNGSGSWPTPKAKDDGSSPEAWEARRARGSRVSQSLAVFAKSDGRLGKHVWPTPKGSPSGPDFARAEREGSGGDDLATRVARETWPTPGTRDHHAQGAGMNTASRSASLATVLEKTKDGLWTTPTPHDQEHHRTAYKQGGNPLSGQAGGQLNPMWVEWLMGFPLGWTDCEHSAMVGCLTYRCTLRAAYNAGLGGE